MAHIICDNPTCFNHDEGTLMFCPECLNNIAQNMSKDDLYEIYLDCEAKLKQMTVIESENNPEILIEARMCSQRLFDMINDLMLLK